MKGLVIYHGKYGATRQYARWLGESLSLMVCEPDLVPGEQLAEAGFVVLGTSVYIGKFGLRDWLQKHATRLAGKQLYLFVVAATPAGEKETWQTLLQNNLPESVRKNCEIFLLPGRLNYQNLSWLDRMLLRVGAFFAEDPAQRKKMLTDFDEVKKENLAPILAAVRRLTPFAAGRTKI
jgi:menaquinone-dependent protoporphyrinogen IX oxidase